MFSFFALRYVRVLFKNQRKSEKWWEKLWELKKKKKIGEQFRKTVENECFGKISHFLINVPKPTENLRKCLKKFWDILRKFLRKSEKYFYQGRVVNLHSSFKFLSTFYYKLWRKKWEKNISWECNINLFVTIIIVKVSAFLNNINVAVKW